MLTIPFNPECKPQGAALTRVRGRIGRRHGFSLVELVIVVVIIGVIAAIAVPRLSSAAGQSNENALIANLQQMRKALDTYSAEHNGVFPGKNPDGGGGGAHSAAAFVSQLTQFSDASGEVSATKTAQHIYGPYLRTIPGVPVGPNKGVSVVAIDTVNTPPLATGGAEGWVYNPNSGAIIANTDAANLDGSRAYDEY